MITKNIFKIKLILNISYNIFNLSKSTLIPQFHQQNISFNFQNKYRFFNNLFNYNEQKINELRNKYQDSLISRQSPEESLQLLDQIIKQSEKDLGKNYQLHQRDQLDRILLLNQLKRKDESQKLQEQLMSQLQDDNQENVYIKCDIILSQSQQELELGNFEKAFEKCIQVEKLLHLVENGSKTDFMSNCAHIMGQAKVHLGEIQQGLQFYEQAAKIQEYLIDNEKDENMKLHHLFKQANYYMSLGNLHSDLRNQKESYQFLDNALKIWEVIIEKTKNKKQDDSKQETQFIEYYQCIYDMANHLGLFGQYDKSIEYYKKAKFALEPLKPQHSELYSQILIGISNVFRKMSLLDEALNFCIQSETITRKQLEENGNYTANIMNLSFILELKSNLYLETNKPRDESLSFLMEAKEKLEKSKLTLEPIYSKILCNIAFFMISNKQYKEAFETAEQSLKIIVQIFGEDDEQVADAYRIMGYARIGQQQIDKGLMYLQDCCQLLQNNVARIIDYHNFLNELYQQYKNHNKYKEAIKTGQQIIITVEKYKLEIFGESDHEFDIYLQTMKKDIEMLQKQNK